MQLLMLSLSIIYDRPHREEQKGKYSPRQYQSHVQVRGDWAVLNLATVVIS